MTRPGSGPARKTRNPGTSEGTASLARPETVYGQHVAGTPDGSRSRQQVFRERTVYGNPRAWLGQVDVLVRAASGTTWSG